jgi:hypothetical protein
MRRADVAIGVILASLAVTKTFRVWLKVRYE